jgi:hypothetical protein
LRVAFSTAIFPLIATNRIGAGMVVPILARTNHSRATATGDVIITIPALPAVPIETRGSMQRCGSCTVISPSMNFPAR